MCKWGTVQKVTLTMPAWLSPRGMRRFVIVEVDACIAGLVMALNQAGLTTVASCCGHGKRPGRISLADGREVIICTYEQAQQIDGIFPNIHGETDAKEQDQD